MDSPVCQRCGRTFAVAEAIARRHPGWTPPLCGECYSGGGTRGDATRARPRPRRNAADLGPSDGVFTDGAASPNPGPGGWGAVYVLGDEVVAEASGHEEWTTNNRMELTAIIHGIDLVPVGTPATVFTDSRLCHQTLTEWAAGWEARGWRRRTGEIANLDLVKEAYRKLRARSELSLAWLPAHAGIRWNEYADRLATSYREVGR